FLGRPRNLDGRLRRARIGEVGRDATNLKGAKIGVIPVVANGEASLERGIPNVARAFFPTGTVGFDFVGVPGQQVRIGRIDRLFHLTSSDARYRNVDVASRPFAVVLATAFAVVDLNALLVHIESARRGRPLPAVHAHHRTV